MDTQTQTKDTEKRTVISFQPDPDVKVLLRRKTNRTPGVSRTHHINEAIRIAFAELSGKRKLNGKTA